MLFVSEAWFSPKIKSNVINEVIVFKCYLEVATKTYPRKTPMKELVFLVNTNFLVTLLKINSSSGIFQGI